MSRSRLCARRAQFAAKRPRLVGVGAMRLRRSETEIPLDGRPERAYGGKLREADGSELRAAHAEIAQAEGDVVILGIEFGQQPGAAHIRRKRASRLALGSRLAVRVKVMYCLLLR